MANELYIYDFIGEGLLESGVTAKSVKAELGQLDKKSRLVVRINTPGGSAFEAININSLLMGWPGGVDVIVDGRAASAGSYIATMGETVFMAEGAMLFVHDPWTMVVGNAADLAKASQDLNEMAESLVDAYVRKSGKTRDEVRAVMRGETWMTADRAIDFGLADKKIGSKAMACAIPAKFGYPNPPEPLVQPVQRPHNRLAAEARRLELIRAKDGPIGEISL